MSGEQFSGEQSAFRIGTNIDKGTTADVHLATHKNSAIPKYVAKTLRSTTEKDEEAFNQEADLIHPKEGLLIHPNIVKAREYKRDRHNGHLYLILDRASEGPLQDVSGQVMRLPANGVDQAAQEIGSVLTYVHKKNYIHNNVNPRDIVLHRISADDRVRSEGKPTFRLIDFGDTIEVGDQTPSLRGDPRYRAPENARAKAVDVYGLGASLYTLVVGKTPYDLPEISPAAPYLVSVDPRERKIVEADMARKHASGAIPAFEDRWDDAWLLNPDDTAIRLSVEGDVRKALSPNPADRQDSVDEFVSEFHDHMRTAASTHRSHRTTIDLGYDSLIKRAPEFLGPKTQGKKAKETPAKKDDDGENKGMDRRRALKIGAGAVGAGLGAWYLVESLINGLSDDGSSAEKKKPEPSETKAEKKPLPTTDGKGEKEKIPENQLISFAEEGILYFKNKGELGLAGEIASLIGNREAAEEGMVYYQGELEDGPAGVIAARIGDLDNADYFMTEAQRKGNLYDAGVIAALIGNTPAAQTTIEELKKIGMPDEAGYIAALMGDEQTATEAIKGGTAPIVGEVHAILGQNQAAQKSMQKWHDKGFYRDAGRIAAILGNDGAVRSEIDNMQNLEKQNPDDIKYRDGWAAYLCAETLWWRERRETQGN